MSLQSGFAAWVGVDWADRRHVVCLREAGSSPVETQTLAQDPAAIHQWLRQLRRRFGGRPVAVALEQSRGALM